MDTNKYLSSLILSFCKIDNIALKFLLKGLKGLKEESFKDKYYLTQLNLSDNNISEEGGEYLGIILIIFLLFLYFLLINSGYYFFFLNYIFFKLFLFVFSFLLKCFDFI